MSRGFYKLFLDFLIANKVLIPLCKNLIQTMENKQQEPNRKKQPLNYSPCRNNAAILKFGNLLGSSVVFDNSVIAFLISLKGRELISHINFICSHIANLSLYVDKTVILLSFYRATEGKF